MASVAVRLRGQAWSAVIKLDGEDRRLIALKLGQDGTREIALQAANALFQRLLADQQRRLKAAAARQTLIDEGVPEALLAPLAVTSMTVADWWAVYQKRYLPYKKRGGKKAARSITLEIQAMQAWLPLIGAIPLVTLSRAEVVEAQNIRRATCVKGTTRLLQETSVAREVIVVKAVLNRAVEEGKLPRNPFATAPQLQATKSNAHRLLTVENEARLFALSESEFPPFLRRFIRFLLLTGLRLDEVLNKHFTDHGHYCTVHGKGSHWREVGLVQEAREVLAAQYASTTTGSGRGKMRRRPVYNSRPWWHHPSNFRWHMQRLGKRIGMAAFSPHDLRHTFGHRWLMAGRDIKLLSLILGHKNVATTEKHYAYMHLSDVRNRMLAVMEPTPPAPAPVAAPAPLTLVPRSA